jgi:hypothetical protein
LFLAGCAEKHEASTTLPPVSDAAAATSSSAAAVPAVGPADFPVPMEARQHTPAGVQAFTRYYIELINHQLASLDSTPLRELSRNCSTCTALANSYDRDRAAGHKYEGGLISVASLGSAGVDGDIGETSFDLRQQAVTVRDASGAPIPTLASAGVALGGGVRLRWEDRRSTWLMIQFDVARN